MLGSAALALWLVGVRDWRVYALCAATDGIVQALHVGSITPLLMLLAAVAWRYRDKALVCGLAIALGIGLKLLLLPLIGWLLVCGRIRAAAAATAGSVVLIAGSWAAIGFAGMSDYNRTVDLLGEVLAWRGFSSRELFLAGGATMHHATIAAYAVALRAPQGIFDLAVQYAFSGYAALSPLLVAALFWKKSTKWGALAVTLWTAAGVAGVALLQSSIPAPPPGAAVPVWSIAGTTVVARIAAGTTVFGLLPVVPMTIVSAALMFVVSSLTPASRPSAATLLRYTV